jgi:hypothetical protein
MCKIWRLWIRASRYNYENNQQDALYRLIYYYKSALHVSGDVSLIIRGTWLYLQYLVVFTQVAAGTSRQQIGWTLRGTVNTAKCPWWWAKHRPKHVKLTCNNKLIYIVHLVGYFHSCITMHGFINVKLILPARPAATWVNTTRYCKQSQVPLMMGENIARNM